MRGNNGGMWQVILPLFSSFIAPVKFPPDGLPLAACPGARSSNEYDKDEEVRHTQKAQTSSQDTGGKDEDFRVCVCVCVCVCVGNVSRLVDLREPEVVLKLLKLWIIKGFTNYYWQVIHPRL